MSNKQVHVLRQQYARQMENRVNDLWVAVRQVAILNLNENVVNSTRVDTDDHVDYVIFSIVTKYYRELALNWWRHLMRLNVPPERVFILSDIDCDELTERGQYFQGVQCQHHADPAKKFGIWLKRTIVVQELLLENLTVISSDVDAVWLKPHALELATGERYRNYDAIFSTGIGPRDAVDEWGIDASVCMGFVVYRPSMAPLLNEMITRFDVAHGWDDQMRMNHLLMRHHVQWSRDPYEKAYKGLMGVNENGDSGMQNITYQFLLMDNSVVMRHCDMPGIDPLKSSVAHCGSPPRNHVAKENVLRSYGLWIE
jgi:hypothetical protein